jgi:hypothetical protein
MQCSECSSAKSAQKDFDMCWRQERGTEEYPDDTPYPSRLIVGCYKGRVIHVVAADNFDDEEIIVITVYEPDTSEWDTGL